MQQQGNNKATTRQHSRNKRATTRLQKRGNATTRQQQGYKKAKQCNNKATALWGNNLGR